MALIMAWPWTVNAKTPTLAAFSIIDDKEVNIMSEAEFPAVVMFWDSTCAPCRVEMKRVQTAINRGAIPAGRVLAVNIGEAKGAVERFARQADFQFQYFAEPKKEDLEQLGPISGTPSLLYIDAAKSVRWRSAGVDPELENRSRKLFGEKSK